MLSSKASKIIMTVLLFQAYFALQTQAAYIMKRDASTEVQIHGQDDQYGLVNALDSAANRLRRVPLVGQIFYSVIEYINHWVEKIEEMTNGALSIIISGSLPCTLSLQGFVCTGVYKNGGYVKLFMRVLDNMPNRIVPSFAKAMIDLLIQMLMDPASDLFG